MVFNALSRKGGRLLDGLTRRVAGTSRAAGEKDSDSDSDGFVGADGTIVHDLEDTAPSFLGDAGTAAAQQQQNFAEAGYDHLSPEAVQELQRLFPDLSVPLIIGVCQRHNWDIQAAVRTLFDLQDDVINNEGLFPSLPSMSSMGAARRRRDRQRGRAGVAAAQTASDRRRPQLELTGVLYQCSVTIADLFLSGTSAGLVIDLIGTLGQSGPQRLRRRISGVFQEGNTNFKRGATEMFQLRVPDDLGDLLEIIIVHDGAGGACCLDNVVVICPDGSRARFICRRWFGGEGSSDEIHVLRARRAYVLDIGTGTASRLMANASPWVCLYGTRCGESGSGKQVVLADISGDKIRFETGAPIRVRLEAPLMGTVTSVTVGADRLVPFAKWSVLGVTVTDTGRPDAAPRVFRPVNGTDITANGASYSCSEPVLPEENDQQSVLRHDGDGIGGEGGGGGDLGVVASALAQPHAMWTCEVCTLQNENAASACVACDAARGVSATVAAAWAHTREQRATEALRLEEEEAARAATELEAEEARQLRERQTLDPAFGTRGGEACSFGGCAGCDRWVPTGREHTRVCGHCGHGEFYHAEADGASVVDRRRLQLNREHQAALRRQERAASVGYPMEESTFVQEHLQLARALQGQVLSVSAADAMRPNQEAASQGLNQGSNQGSLLEQRQTDTTRLVTEQSGLTLGELIRTNPGFESLEGGSDEKLVEMGILDASELYRDRVRHDDGQAGGGGDGDGGATDHDGTFCALPPEVPPPSAAALAHPHSQVMEILGLDHRDRHEAIPVTAEEYLQAFHGTDNEPAVAATFVQGGAAMLGHDEIAREAAHGLGHRGLAHHDGALSERARYVRRDATPVAPAASHRDSYSHGGDVFGLHSDSHVGGSVGDGENVIPSMAVAAAETQSRPKDDDDDDDDDDYGTEWVGHESTTTNLQK